MGNRKILFLSYYFPPMPQIGGKRIDKMCIVALKRGWLPIVLTSESISNFDEPVSLRFGKVEVYRVAVRRRAMHEGQSVSEKGGSLLKGLLSKIKTNLSIVFPSLRIKLSKIKDDLMRFLWMIEEVIRFYKYSKKILKDKDISHYLTSVPSFSLHIVGLLIKNKNRKLKWIADFRDPILYPKDLDSKSFSARLKIFSFKLVLNKADLIIATTGSIIAFLEKVGGREIHKKVLTIPNSVDIKMFDLMSLKRDLPSEVICLGHLGDLDYKHRNPSNFLRALSSIVSEGKFPGKQIELHFWGKSSTLRGKALLDLEKELSLEEVVFNHQHVSHADAMGLTLGLDILIIFAFDQVMQIPAKTYEYLVSNVPILALCEESSETGQLLRQFSGVTIVESDDYRKIREGLSKVICEVLSPNGGKIRNNLSQLHYENSLSPLFEWIVS